MCRSCKQVLALAHQLAPGVLRRPQADTLWDDLRCLLDMQARTRALVPVSCFPVLQPCLYRNVPVSADCLF